MIPENEIKIQNSNNMNSESVNDKTSDNGKKVMDVQEVQLRWNNINVSVGSTKIVENLSGTIKPRTITGLIGPSGCGKTTLIGCLTNVVNPSFKASGEIYLNDTLANEHLIKNFVSFASNDTFSYPILSMYDQVLMASMLRCSNPKETTLKIIEILGMAEHQDKKFVILSGGQKIRCLVGICMALQTPIIILDEPTTGLDAMFAQQLVEEIKELGKMGRTVLLSIHQPSEMILESLSDIIVMSAFGHIVFQGTLEEAQKHFTKIGFPKTKDYITDADHYIRLVYARASREGTYNKSVRERLNTLKKSWTNEMFPCENHQKLIIEKTKSISFLKGRLVCKGHGYDDLDKKAFFIFAFNFLNIHFILNCLYYRSVSLYSFFARNITNPFGTGVLNEKLFFNNFFSIFYKIALLAYGLGFFQTKKPMHEVTTNVNSTEYFNHLTTKFCNNAMLSKNDQHIYKECVKMVQEKFKDSFNTLPHHQINFVNNLKNLSKYHSETLFDGYKKETLEKFILEKNFGSYLVSNEKQKFKTATLIDVEDFMSSIIKESFEVFGNNHLNINGDLFFLTMLYRKKENCLLYYTKTFLEMNDYYDFYFSYYITLLLFCKPKFINVNYLIKDPLIFNGGIALNEVATFNLDYCFKDLFGDAYLLLFAVYLYVRFAFFAVSNDGYLDFIDVHRKEYQEGRFSIIGFMFSLFSYSSYFYLSGIILDLIFISVFFITKAKFILIVPMYLSMFAFMFLIDYIYTMLLDNTVSIAYVIKAVARAAILTPFIISSDVLVKLSQYSDSSIIKTYFNSVISYLNISIFISILKRLKFLSISNFFDVNASLMTSIFCIMKILLSDLILFGISFLLTYSLLNSKYTKFNYRKNNGNHSRK